MSSFPRIVFGGIFWSNNSIFSFKMLKNFNQNAGLHPLIDDNISLNVNFIQETYHSKMKNSIEAFLVVSSVVGCSNDWDNHCNPIIYVLLCNSFFPTDNTAAAHCANKIASICQGKKSGHHCDPDDDFYDVCTWTFCDSLTKTSCIDNCANNIFKICHEED